MQRQSSHQKLAASLCAQARLSTLAPLDVANLQHVGVVGVGDVVAKVVCLLPLDASHVAAAEDDLLAPEGTRGALREDVVLGAEEEVGNERSADTIVPRPRLRWKGGAPHFADALQVVGVVHVQLWQLLPSLGARDMWERL